MEIEEFAKWLFTEGKAAKTIESYVNDVKGFQSYLQEKLNDVPILSRFSFVRYKEHLMKEDYAISTINKKINSLKVYNDFLRTKGHLSESFIQLKRDRIKIAAGSEDNVDALTDEQVEELLFYVENRSKVRTRNKLIVYLLLYTGVRVSELIGIKIVDIDFLMNQLAVIGKGGKRREIGLRQDVLQLVRDYMKEERSESNFSYSDYLLVSQRAEKMHRDAVRDWLAKISKELGFKLHPHLFRHTFCTRLLKKGVDLTTVSKLAGHSTVNMTARFYIQTTKQEKMDAVNLL
ncbi:integrase [Heyndrickxia sporothermodurans]|uniref:Tyrosine-type recombinase/integrase n=1 Tax=Heyndrickxia sporothermodurans TaxID=46224 RepID=A0AB37HCU3_9BACI|nr:tyrosine-type recombinase/integrase [Heyndrickxia sporothermodurans]MBL5768068.1 tyrosine-type recombinase/integrase [Heyndrickxia sporothermodurans]MBL5771678.1 tyrosine-type recombinase/integrase [Heyndrickxia sporothermodurans]MBL5775306.1 tyrosine-type recombinase/integrase [Heyndrickxia sporothermodurans]MBL5778795.1 tyrosine-type recombinase/integrase [Heyndrickxia sporothermodurans]MBL5782451.1 tyrosine-type recombinase/integrase [Heyndrickxia sporothermodurans]